MPIFPLPKADGSREFICTECKTHVFQAVSDEFEFPICMLCRWHGERPWIKRTESAPVDN